MVYYDMYFILVNIDEDQMNWTCKYYQAGIKIRQYNCICDQLEVKTFHYFLQCVI